MNALRPSIPQIPFDPVRSYATGAGIGSMRRRNILAESLGERGMALQEGRFAATKEERERQRDLAAYTRMTELMGRVIDEPSYRTARNMFLRDFPEEAEDFPESYEQGKGLISLFAERPEAKGYAPGTEIGRVTQEGWEPIHKVKAKPTAKRKIGETRVFRKGTKRITQEWTGTEWSELATGEAFAPKDPGTTGELTKTQAIARYQSLINNLYDPKLAAFGETTGEYTLDPNWEIHLNEINDLAKETGREEVVDVDVPTKEGTEKRFVLLRPGDTVEDLDHTARQENLSRYKVLQALGLIE